MIENDPDLLNAVTFTRLRVRAGRSRKALGKAAGVSETVICGIEQGRNHRTITLGIAKALADALGTTLSHLARPTGAAVAPDSDDAVLEAALAVVGRHARTHEVALALDWSLERTRLAATDLARRLHGTGQTLIHTGWDQLKLAAADVLDSEQQLRLARSGATQRRLSRRTASVLAAFLADGMDAFWLQRTSASHRAALSELIDMGILNIVHHPHTHAALSEEFKYLSARFDGRKHKLDRSGRPLTSLES